MSKEREGKGCLICMNVLLLILGAILAGSAIYAMNAKELPPVFEGIKSNCMWLMFGGIALVIFAIVGFCASCGGCLLYLYCIIITLLSIVFLIVDIALFVVFFCIKGGNSLTIESIDNATLSVIQKENYTEEWKGIQDTLKCCGYNNILETKTGKFCTEATPVDCKEMFINACENYSLYAAIVCLVVLIVLLILSCASCKRWKDDDCC